MSLDDDVVSLQVAYPQIWFACHVQHHTRRTSALTDRDASILAHVQAAAPVHAAELALHLGIGKPALSAHLTRLERGGLLRVAVDATDRRIRVITLTAAGRKQLSVSSPLDADRVRALLAVLTADERADAIRGLTVLASAGQRLRGTRNDGTTPATAPIGSAP